MARERLLTTSAKKKEQGRPSAAHLWLRRSRRFVGPALFGSAILMGFGLIAYGIAAVDPASQARRMLDTVAVFGSDRSMTVQAVIVDGRQNTPLPLIREALGVSRGDAMLGFSPEAARQRLESIPWVAQAHVERHLPATIVVRLEERRPFAIWQNQGRFVIVDRQGKTVATDGLDQFGPLPLIVGPGADQAAAALYDLLAAETEVAERVQAMVRVGERRWNLRLHSGTDVLLPEAAEAAAIKRLAELQQEAKLLDRPLAAIDLRLPDRLVVRANRETPETPPARPTARRERG
jgi:cell division protein FtsQ